MSPYHEYTDHMYGMVRTRTRPITRTPPPVLSMAAATQIAIKNRHKMAGRRPETRLPHLDEANETYVETVGKCCTCLRSSPCWDCLTHSEAWLCVCLPCICCTRCLSAYSSKHAIVVHDTRPHPRCPSSQQLRQSSSPQVNAIQR